MLNDGTIDITDTVEKMKETWVLAEKEALMAAILAIPGLGWIAFPIAKVLLGAAVHWTLTFLSNSGLMIAFFTNTVLRKASQAKDFTDAYSNKMNLPPTATDEEYEKAERIQIDKFNNFVRLTN